VADLRRFAGPRPGAGWRLAGLEVVEADASDARA